MTVIVLLCSVEILTSFKQLFEGYSLSCVLGTTSRPVELSLCLTLCVPFLFYICSELKSWRTIRFYKRMLLLYVSVCLVLSLMFILAIGSRASWVAVLVGVGVVLFFMLPVRFQGLYKYVLILLCIVSVCGLYFVRTNSADGRILIWKITTRELFGGNVTILPREGNFSTFIGLAQQNYFSQENRPVKEQMLAGAPTVAYNEVLQMVVEWGVLMTVAVVCGFIVCIYGLCKLRGNCRIALLGALSGFVVLSMFSYPLRCVTSSYFVSVVLLMSVVICLRNKKLKYGVMMIGLSVVAVGSALAFQNHKRVNQGLSQCRQLELLSQYGVTNEYLDCYKRLLPYLYNNPEYLLSYSKALYDYGLYGKSVLLLRKAQQISGDPIFYLIEGKCRQAMKQYSHAERLYKYAYYRIPHKTYPLYLLMCMYKECHQKNKSVSVAKKILSIPPKVKSKEFEYIQLKANQEIMSK